MKAFVAVTDRDWYEFLSRRSALDEVNLWQYGPPPAGNANFAAVAACT